MNVKKTTLKTKFKNKIAIFCTASSQEEESNLLYKDMSIFAIGLVLLKNRKSSIIS